MKQRLIYLLLLAATLSGCDNASLQPQPTLPESGQQEITFNLSLREGGKSVPITQSRSTAPGLSDGFYLMGCLTDKPNAQGTVSGYLFGQDDTTAFAEKIDPDGTYTGSKRFWKKDGTTYHTFWAYTSSTGNTLDTYTAPWSVKHQLSAAPTEQTDILMASATDLLAPADAPAPVVNLEFYHATSRVMFRVYGSGGAPVNDVETTITYGSNKVNLLSTGNHMYRKATVGTTAKASGTYTLCEPFALPGTANDFASAIEVGDLLLQPQALSADWLTITFTFIPPNKTRKTSVSATLPAMTLEMEKQYNVTLNLIAESQMIILSQITLTNWGTPVTGTVDPW